jgi:cytochrome P450
MFVAFFLVIFGFFLLWALLHAWYFQLVTKLSDQVHHQDGRCIPGEMPELLLGNMATVYSAQNQLAAYHDFHEKFGEIVQIFWMWRQQISITNYRMANQILISHQKDYGKYPPNWVIQQLYGSSVLTNSGDAWRRQRLLMNEVFSKTNIPNFHHIFGSHAMQLADKWAEQIDLDGESIQLDIYPDLTALFLDIIGEAAISHQFKALQGKADEFLAHLHYVIQQSTRPAHQFTKWWKFLPLPSNRRLAEAFAAIDRFLKELIWQRREIAELPDSASSNLLDLLLKSGDIANGNEPPLSEQEVRDNLLAIIVNGHETVATSVAFSLYLLAQYPDQMICLQSEVDRAIAHHNGQLTTSVIEELHYLDSAINESLRLYPPMAGLQRISDREDVLEGWTIPAQQAIGIPLMPLHMNEEYFGSEPNQFRPERYLDRDLATVDTPSSGTCPMQWLRDLGNRAAPCLPLAFGDGARKCLGEHFARYEMKVAIAMLVHRFDFQVAANFEIEPELGKFGLFISMFPKGGVELVIRHRQPAHVDVQVEMQSMEIT